MEPENDVYKKRISRARSMNKLGSSGAGSSAAPPLDSAQSSSFKLDLGSLTVSGDGRAPVEGDHKLGQGGEAGVLTTPRAAQEEAITVRGVRCPKRATASHRPHRRDSRRRCAAR